MQIAVRANALQKQEFLSRSFPDSIEWIWMDETDPAAFTVSADAFFDLCFEEDKKNKITPTSKPVFVSAVMVTCSGLPENYIRINAWPGFLNRAILELAVCNEAIKKEAEKILMALNWPFQQVADNVGMITPRIIAMIINEAYFALGEKISTKAEIDTAMKLGTNYPFGPFEWAEKIGIEKCYRLLKKLYEEDARYTIAPVLEAYCNKK